MISVSYSLSGAFPQSTNTLHLLLITVILAYTILVHPVVVRLTACHLAARLGTTAASLILILLAATSFTEKK